MTGNPSLICVREGLPTSRPERYLRASHNPDCRAKSEANAGTAPIPWLLLNLHSGVGSELPLAFDASLTYRFEFSRVSDFVE